MWDHFFSCVTSGGAILRHQLNKTRKMNDPKKKQGKTMICIEHCKFFWTSRDAWNGLHAKRGVSETILSLYNRRQFTKYDRIAIILLISYRGSRSRLSRDSEFGEFG